MLVSDPDALTVVLDPSASVLDRIRAAQALPPELRSELREELAALDELAGSNPLVLFTPHSDGQREFFAARSRIVAAFAGNRFGKTTSLIVKSIVECVDRDALPEHLRPFKRWDSDNAPSGTYGRIVCPGFGPSVEGVLLPAVRQWAPMGQFKGGSFDKAWDKQLRVLHFTNGSTIEFMTYKQDLQDFGGAARHFIGYDEPPPKLIRDECQMRTADYGGFEMFALTPLEGAGWMRRQIWAKRNAPDVTVVTGSIHDNPTIDQPTKQAILEGYGENDIRRRAREFGEFVEFGDNLIYPDFYSTACDPPTKQHVQGLQDIAVGIDPGMRNAGFVFVGFDQDNTGLVFEAHKLKNSTPKDYATLIRRVLGEWGIPHEKVRFIIDPAARNRELATGQNVEALLTVEGIYCQHGQNAVEAGVQQVRNRIASKGLLVSREKCDVLFEEADDYRTQAKPDGEFHIVKENDHVLDPLRYVCMSRLYVMPIEQPKPKGRDMSESWMPPFRGPEKPVAPTGAFT